MTKAQTPVIRVSASRKIISAIFSARCRRFTLRVLSAQYARPHALRNNRASIDMRSSAQVPTDFICRITLNRPITVRQTPTIVADAVKICTEISSSKGAFEPDFFARWLVLRLLFIFAILSAAI